jgi:choline dehydrogenase-like flavoprotein
MTIRDWSAVTGDKLLSTGVVVVGSGPGGAAIARILAESGAQVVMLEEGPAKPMFRPNAAHTNRYHMQEGGAMMARGTLFMPIAAGRGIGGGSLVNSALCFRTPDEVLDQWCDQLQTEAYRPSAMKPVFDEVERIIGLTVTTEKMAGENNLIVVRGAKALGLPGGLAPRNAPKCIGCGMCNFGCPSGGKASVDLNFIPRAQAAGMTIQADCRVDRVLQDNGRAVGVSGVVRHPETGEIQGRLEVLADTVIIACGGIGTPRLLHESGIANKLGPVGQGLHVHPGSAVIGECDHEVRMWTGATQGAYFHDPELPGMLPHTFTAPPGAVLLLTGKVGLEAKEAMHRAKFLCGCITMISDKGEGTVGARSSGRANIKYHFADNDIYRIKLGMVRTAEVLMAGGAKRLMAPVHGVGVHDNVASFKQALMPRTIREFTMYASHPMASCRMGLDPETSVVGPTGEAHRLKGLYVADSSVFPSSLGVNPQLTTMALATVIGRQMTR